MSGHQHVLRGAGLHPSMVSVSSDVQMGEEPQQGVMEKCSGCISSLYEYKDKNMLLGISVCILFAGFLSGFCLVFLFVCFKSAKGNIFVNHWTQAS